MIRHFLKINDIPRSELGQVLLRAKELKDKKIRNNALEGKTIIMIFEKASTRTRVSFDVAIEQLGGHSIFMTPAESQLGRSEPLEDTAQVLSRYADALVVRTFGQRKVRTLAQNASIPVINALTDRYHPCQVMSDMLTIYERTPDLNNVQVAWVGDGNNMAHSWINAAIYFPFYLTMAFPKGYEPDHDILSRALSMGAKINLSYDPVDAVKGAHYVNTDVFASMGQEDEQKKREMAFLAYQVNDKLLEHADPDCKVMHCLPAHRGEEVTAEVLDGPRSIIFDQAENRLHMQKAILEWAINGIEVDLEAVSQLLGPVQAVPHMHTIE
ncbi:ornithine carbamoyltransferase [Maridesulfovibrio hydrothermalis]|uniref:Ornithine carbamoyltransferase n=1 Tax=Maridesulfovibrio hydrothermalis AM13 = DSM 14728 TaxID=1121451 RepID=L0RD46_9BACT|nr:ornithine carbamoyltransferase [Maridesulfovibrio hydrothermalis]CCO24679.1 Ornithine carbamoyltransferase [Maridesulfovibrio hydrothermalis AM13 = DSM 14728]